MTKGLKSITLHFGILLVFLYGAEIFKQNKRFEIYEIPLEIIDVSDQTVNKTDKIKKSKKSISKINFFCHLNQNPNPPPDFFIKRRKQKKEKEKKRRVFTTKKEKK